MGIDFQRLLEGILHNLKTKRTWIPEWKSLNQRNLDNTEYRGFNRLSLAAHQHKNGFSNATWGTFNAIRKRGGHVKKDSRGTMILFWKVEDPNEDDEDENQKRRFILRTYIVFNRNQCEGLPEEQEIQVEKPKELEAIWDQFQNKPKLSVGDYQPSYYDIEDVIKLPSISQFNTTEAYYSALFHEAIHSTGHKKRLNRKSMYDYYKDMQTRSREELVAELGAILLLAKCQINPRPNNQAYVNDWVRFLQEKPREVITAFAQAQKAFDHIIPDEQKQQKAA